MSKKFLAAQIMPDEEIRPQVELERFLTVFEVASMFCVRPSTVYQWTSSGEIPHYKLRRTVRFRRKDLDTWLNGCRKEGKSAEKKAREILRSVKSKPPDIDRIVKKCIAEVKGNRYTPSPEKPGKDKGLGKEGNDGFI